MAHIDSGNTFVRVNGVTYNIQDIFPTHHWDRYWSRLSRYEIFDGYYNNIAYNRLMRYSETLKTTERLYKHIRGVYNPVARLVNLYVAKIFPGTLDLREARQGAIPIIESTPELNRSITQLWQSSNWNQKKNVYVRNGVRFGDSFIKIVDDIENERVFMQVVDPRKVKRVRHDATGRVIFIEFEFQLEIDRAWHTVGQIITPEKFITTKNGRPTPMFQNGRGEMVAEWDNEYGFVPVVHTMHTDIDRRYGANDYYTQLHKINELNDLASINNDGARKQANMPLVIIGDVVNSLDYGSDNSTDSSNPDDRPRKDTKRVLNLTKDSDAKPIPPSIDLNATLANIKELLLELERDMPELSLHRIRETGGDLSAPGVATAYNDAVSKLENKQGIYSAGQIVAHQMGVAIGGFRGYTGYESFNLISLESGLLEHNINPVAIVGDRLSRREKLTQTGSFLNNANTPPFVYQEIGWDESQSQVLTASSQAVANPFGFAAVPANPAGALDQAATDESTITADDLVDIA
jgi:hypothetical protein